jgi:predicted acyl esterase
MKKKGEKKDDQVKASIQGQEANLSALPPEGKRDYLTEHPFLLKKYPLPAGIVEEQVTIPMRDGINLAATVFRPESGDAVPVIVTATPYGKDKYDQWSAFQDPPIGTVPGGGFYLGEVTISDRTAFEAPDPGYWVPHGYAVMLVDLPGLGKSESNPSGTPGPEARWHDVMAWIEEQPWNTGNVGMSGVSALCATQWIAAKDPAPKQLKAIIPWEGFNETGPGGGYGGIPEIVFPDWLKKEWIGPNINPNAKGPEPFLFEWQYDTANIRTPALVCCSFSDQELHTWDTFEAFTRMKSKNKWLYGHRRQKWGAFYGEPELELQKRFLDRFLKGVEGAMDGIPKVRLEINSSRFNYKVVNAEDWPIPGTRYEKFYLNATTSTLSTKPPEAASSVTFAGAPAGDNDNRAVFDLIFDKDTDLIGHMVLRLFVEAQDTDDFDIFVGVEKLDENGDEKYFFSASGGNANGPVTRGWLRASNRHLNTERSTEWRPVLAMDRPEPMPRNRVVAVDIPIMPSGTSFGKGETLRLVVQSWSIPGQWEGGETRQWDTIKTGQCRLHTGSETASYLLVPDVSNARLVDGSR